MASDSTLTKPEVQLDGSAAPEDLVIEDVWIGGGPMAVPGCVLSTHYVGVHHNTGAEFDASWNRGAPLEFTLGVGRVIPGWELGLVGMRLGGRRRLTVPAKMAYGEHGARGFVEPGECLVFVVDLLDVRWTVG